MIHYQLLICMSAVVVLKNKQSANLFAEALLCAQFILLLCPCRYILSCMSVKSLQKIFDLIPHSALILLIGGGCYSVLKR